MIVLLTIGVISGCGVHMEKRKHRKGFHISWNKNHRSVRSNSPSETLSADRKVTSKDSPLLKERESVTSIHQIQEHQNFEKKDRASISGKVLNNSTTIEQTSLSQIEKVEEKLSNKGIVRTKKQRNHSSYLYLVSMLAFPFLALNRKRNYRFASWAATNKRKAQWGIGLGTTVAFLSSYFLGRIWNFDTSHFGVEISLILGSIGGIIYVLSQKISLKTLGSMILGSGAYFGAFTLGTMRANMHFMSDSQLGGIVLALLTILLVAALLGSLYGIAILSCELSCNGYGFAAGALLIGGSYLVSFLFMVGIFNIWRPDLKGDGTIAKKAALWALVVMGGLAVLLIGIPLLLSL